MNDEKFSQEELQQLFPDGIPIYLAKLIFPEKSEPLTNGEVRKILNESVELRNLHKDSYVDVLPSGRNIFEVANQLGGYPGPGTEERLAKFLYRESDMANELAEEIVRLRIRLKEYKNNG